MIVRKDLRHTIKPCRDYPKDVGRIEMCVYDVWLYSVNQTNQQKEAKQAKEIEEEGRKAEEELKEAKSYLNLLVSGFIH